jgi:hypothetical protein
VYGRTGRMKRYGEVNGGRGVAWGERECMGGDVVRILT